MWDLIVSKTVMVASFPASCNWLKNDLPLSHDEEGIFGIPAWMLSR